MDGNVSNTFICLDVTGIRRIQYAVFIHAYVFGALCLVLLLMTSWITYKLIRKRIKIRFLLTVELLAIAFFTFRVVFLLVDPYRVRGILPELIDRFVEDLAVPCLTSAFALVQLTFWELTKLRIMEMHRLSLLVGIIITHFVVILLIDFIVIFAQGVCVLLVLCQSLTILWGLILSGGFFVTVRRLHAIQKENNNTLRRKEVMSRDQPVQISSVSVKVEEHQPTTQVRLPATSSDGVDPKTEEYTAYPKMTTESRSSPKSQNKNRHLLKVTIFGTVTSLLGLACFCLGVYGMIFFSNPSRQGFDIWGWFIFQNLQRSVEVGFGLTLSYLAWQRKGS